MLTINLPRLVGSREAANALVADLTGDAAGSDVVVNCRELISASPSFADQLVRRLLVEEKVQALIFDGADHEFQRQIRYAASQRGVTELITFMPAGATSEQAAAAG